jgi:hypothetical protein
MSTTRRDERTRKAARRALTAVNRILAAAEELRKAQEALVREAGRPPLRVVNVLNADEQKGGDHAG